VSKDFPWTIELTPHTGYGGAKQPVYVGDLWEAIYQILHEPVAESEWALLALGWGERRRRENIERAADRRRERARAKGDREGAKDKRILRIDWLGEETVFKGLEKDDEFAKKVLLPTQEHWDDTWVIKMGS
jgi:hypothetical protein